MAENIERLEDVVSVERTPFREQHIPETTYDVVRTAANKFGSSTAIEFFLETKDYKVPHTVTYQSLFENVNRTANMFRSNGIGRNDVVAFVLPNLPQTHYVIWGGEAAGRILSLNPLLEKEHLKTLMIAAKAKWLVCLGPTPGADIWEKCVEACVGNDAVKGIFQVTVAPYLTTIKKAGLGLLSIKSRVAAQAKLRKPVKSFNLELYRHSPIGLKFEEPQKDDVASYFCTGGTTGLPKIAARKHSSETYNAWAMVQMVIDSFSPGKAIFCGLPLFHVNGQIVTGLAPWYAGGRVVIGTPLGYRGEGVVKNFWKIIEQYKVSAFSGVPTLYAALMEQPINGLDISTLEAAICGAAPMPKELFRRFKDATGVPIVEGYGCTEGTCASSVNPGLSDDTIGSIGIRLPYQKMKALIVDDNGEYVRDAKPDEVGSIAISGPNVFMGYLEETQNRGIWINRDNEKWLNTGDLGREDDSGYFWLTGRKKELIIRGGHNIDPKMIEEVLHKHPAVKLAAAVGRPDTYAGEVPVAYVELQEGQKVTEQELTEFAEKNVQERAAWPKSIIIIDTMPVTPVGKIFKPSLLMLEITHVVHFEANSLGNTLNKVAVKQDSKRGLVANIDSVSNTDKLQERLEQYSFSFEFV